jgi:hypothetical protein
MFTDTEKVNIRRHLGYPFSGNAATQHFGVRFMRAWGALEYKLNHLASEEEAMVRSYLTQCDQLETDLYTVRENADTALAAVWTRNPAELAEREALYTKFRMKLVGLFDVPPGPALCNSTTRRVV